MNIFFLILIRRSYFNYLGIRRNFEICSVVDSLQDLILIVNSYCSNSLSPLPSAADGALLERNARLDAQVLSLDYK